MERNFAFGFQYLSNFGRETSKVNVTYLRLLRGFARTYANQFKSASLWNRMCVIRAKQEASTSSDERTELFI